MSQDCSGLILLIENGLTLHRGSHIREACPAADVIFRILHGPLAELDRLAPC